MTKAFQLREHASEREKIMDPANYYQYVTGELDKAAQTYQEQMETYPRELIRLRFPVFGVYAAQGQYEKATEIAQAGPAHYAALGDSGYGYSVTALYDIALQRFDEARQMIHERRLENSNDFHFHCHPLQSRLPRGGRRGDRGTGAVVCKQARIGERWTGVRIRYRGLRGASCQSAGTQPAGCGLRHSGRPKGECGRFFGECCPRASAYGNTAEARQSAAEGLKLFPTSLGVEVEAALAFAMAGDTARAESLAQDLGNVSRLDTQIQSLWLPAIRAQLALDRKDSTVALDSLPASPIELGNVPFGNPISCLYHVYVRGEAHLAAGNGRAAAAEFQKIIDHNGIVWNCWTGALARLGVARANALQSRTSQGADADTARVRALAAYKDFLTLWKNADPDIPILKQAKAEYAKLQ